VKTSDAPTGYLELIRGNADFRRLWYGQIVSLLGDWFNLIASAALVASLTKSGFAVGALFVVRMLAPFLASPIAGVVADRYNRKQVLIWTDILRGLVVLGFLLVRDQRDVWLLYALTAVQLAISGFFFTARTSILPDIVSPRAIGTANAITSATWSTMLALGAAAGGLVAGTLGVYAAYVIDAATFFLSAVIIAGIRFDWTPREHDGERTLRSVLVDYTAGLRLLAGDRDMLLIALQKAVLMMFFGSAFQVVQVTIAEQRFVIGQGGSLSVGVLFAALGVGTGVGPLLARRLTGDRPMAMRVAILAGYFVAAGGLAVFSQLTSLGVAVIGSLLVGLGNGQLWVFSTQLLLQMAPAAVRGRVFATEFAFLSLASAAGSAVIGAALDRGIHPATAVQIMALTSLLPALVWTVWTLPQCRRGE